MTDYLSLSRLSRDQLLHKSPTRQASVLLIAIENRTGYLIGKSRQVAARFLTEKSAEELDHAFLEALSMGRDAPIRPSVQDLEHYAPQWASLATEKANVRAGIARLMGQKYRLPYASIPAIRVALGLDTEEVRQAFQHDYNQPLESIYAAQIDARERFRWAWTGLAWRLENLPPFWMAFGVTFTETVGASILALPIALAGIGPLPGVVILLVLGLLNVLTIMGLSEAIVRNGRMRYGGYFGRLVNDYLGNWGTVTLSIALLLIVVIILIAFYMGVTTTLAGVTGIPAWLWMIPLFLVGFYFLRRETMGATIASALVVGAINIGLILILSVLTLPHVQGMYLQQMRIPFVNGQPFDPSILGLIFGVILTGYAGHLSVGNVAGYVLRREPSGRALIWGNAAATSVAIVLYCLWTVAVGGSVAPERLLNASGTSLIPLAEIVGPVVQVLGTILVVLSMGMSSIHMMLALFNQARQWLPTRPTDSTEWLDAAPTPSWKQRVRAFVSGNQGRFWLSAAPVIVLALFVEWMLITGQGSFAGLLSFMGIIVIPIETGIFAVLMLVASRRKGEYVPGVAWPFLGWTPVVVVIYLVFLASIFLHGLIIWQEPVQRITALISSAGVVAMTIAVIRKGAFAPRAVVEVRSEEGMGDCAVFNVTVAGKPMVATVCLDYDQRQQEFSASSGEIPALATLRSVVFRLPPLQPRELKVWVHHVTSDSTSQIEPAHLDIRCGSERQHYDLTETGGQVLVQVSGQPCELTIQYSR